jgi:hypothetical protein
MRRYLLLLALLLLPRSAFAQVSVQLSVPAIRVTAAPPPLRVEVRPAQPSPAHIWIAGNWAWRMNAHAWMPGHWALPPQPGYVWEPARWVNQNGSWMFYEGHWRASVMARPTVIYQPPPPPPQPIEVETAPPPPIVEVRPVAPFAGAVWIPGYWHWNGERHVWLAGTWSAPREGYVWVPARWEAPGHGRGMGRHRFVPGHWERR